VRLRQRARSVLLAPNGLRNRAIAADVGVARGFDENRRSQAINRTQAGLPMKAGRDGTDT
jgi:FixJ family two-component response regulator